MAINYIWNCKTVDVKTINDKEDVVFNVHWKLTGIDDANNDENDNPHTTTIYGSQILDTSDLSSFTNFEDLSNEQVTGWVESALGENKVEETKNSIADSIANLVTPTQETKTIGE
tara:strand:+ start:1740 stop:2084 length:345 start_codon:yes stop_codon:yes gene_type:complete